MGSAMRLGWQGSRACPLNTGLDILCNECFTSRKQINLIIISD